MKKFLTILFICISLFACAQFKNQDGYAQFQGRMVIGVSLATPTIPNTSVHLQLGDSATNKAFWLPRAQTTGAIAGPRQGMFLYSITDSSIYHYALRQWIRDVNEKDTVALLATKSDLSSLNVNRLYYIAPLFALNDTTLGVDTSRGVAANLPSYHYVDSLSTSFNHYIDSLSALYKRFGVSGEDDNIGQNRVSHFHNTRSFTLDSANSFFVSRAGTNRITMNAFSTNLFSPTGSAGVTVTGGGVAESGQVISLFGTSYVSLVDNFSGFLIRDSILINPHDGVINIDSLAGTTDTTNLDIVVRDRRYGTVKRINNSLMAAINKRFGVSSEDDNMSEARSANFHDLRTFTLDSLNALVINRNGIARITMNMFNTRLYSPDGNTEVSLNNGALGGFSSASISLLATTSAELGSSNSNFKVGDSISFYPYLGIMNIDTVARTTDSTNFDALVWDRLHGTVKVINSALMTASTPTLQAVTDAGSITTNDMVAGTYRFNNFFTTTATASTGILGFGGGNVVLASQGADNATAGGIRFQIQSLNNSVFIVPMVISPQGRVGIYNTDPGEMLTLGNSGTDKGVMSMAGNTSGRVIIQPAAAAGSWVWTLPTNDGTPGQFLQTDGNGITSWQTSAGGVTSVAAGYGTNFSTITGTGSIIVDSTAIATRTTQQNIIGIKTYISQAAGNVPVIIKGASSQTGDLIEFKDNADAILARVKNGGGIELAGTFGSGSGLNLGFDPNITTSHIYSYVSGAKPMDLWSSTLEILTGSGAVRAMYVDASGNLKIGTGTPSERLDVAGNIRFSGALMPNNAAGTSGQFLMSNGASTAPTWADFPVLSSGNWNPDLTNIENVTSSGRVGNFHWMRLGDEVTIAGLIDIEPTVNHTRTRVDITLPFGIDSNFDSPEQAAGVGNCKSTNTPFSMFAQAPGTVRIEFLSTDVDNNEYNFSCTYRILVY